MQIGMIGRYRTEQSIKELLGSSGSGGGDGINGIVLRTPITPQGAYMKLSSFPDKSYYKDIDIVSVLSTSRRYDLGVSQETPPLVDMNSKIVESGKYGWISTLYISCRDWDKLKLKKVVGHVPFLPSGTYHVGDIGDTLSHFNAIGYGWGAAIITAHTQRGSKDYVASPNLPGSLVAGHNRLLKGRPDTFDNWHRIDGMYLGDDVYIRNEVFDFLTEMKKLNGKYPPSISITFTDGTTGSLGDSHWYERTFKRYDDDITQLTPEEHQAWVESISPGANRAFVHRPPGYYD